VHSLVRGLGIASSAAEEGRCDELVGLGLRDGGAHLAAPVARASPRSVRNGGNWEVGYSTPRTTAHIETVFLRAGGCRARILRLYQARPSRDSGRHGTPKPGCGGRLVPVLRTGHQAAAGPGRRTYIRHRHCLALKRGFETPGVPKKTSKVLSASSGSFSREAPVSDDVGPAVAVQIGGLRLQHMSSSSLGLSLQKAPSRPSDGDSASVILRRERSRSWEAGWSGRGRAWRQLP